VGAAIVDPDAEWVKVLRRAAEGDDKLGRALLLAANQGDVLTTPLFPGLSLPVAAIFG
jgi:hypothetical protein